MVSLETKTNNGLLILVMLSLVFCVVIMPAHAEAIDGKYSKFTADQNLNAKITNVDATQFNKFFEYKGRQTMKPLSSALVSVGNNRNINSVFLMALGAWEGQWGSSDYARTRNNYFGYGALYGAPYKAWEFKSPAECVDVVASHIKAEYLINHGVKYTVLVPTKIVYEKNRNHSHMSFPYTPNSIYTGQYYDSKYGATIHGWIKNYNMGSTTEMNGILSIMNDFASWHVKTYGTPITTTKLYY